MAIKTFAFIVVGLLLSSLAKAETALAPISASAKWSVEMLGSEVWATHPKHKGLRIPLRPAGGGTPEVTTWEESKQAPGVFILKYNAGEIGTSERVIELRAVVVRLKTRKILADEVFSYLKARDPEQMSGPQPQWTWTPKVLLIEVPDEDAPKKVSL